MPSTNSSPPSILIAGITPYFLERGALPVPKRAAEGGSGSGWFEENFEAIQRKAKTDPWWREHTAFVEVGAKLPYSPFLRRLSDMGYAKVSQVHYRGEFASRGGIVDIFPINLEHPVRLEFSGNIVENVTPLPSTAEQKTPKPPQPKDPTEYERLWLSGIRSGDHLVHVDHGIGIFRGMTTDQNDESGETDKIVRRNEPGDSSFLSSGAIHRVPPKGGRFIEYYVLEYAPPRKGGMPDTLRVPRAQAKKLSRYIGFETPAIHRLGGTAWETTKKKAREEARTFAQELAALYRSRAAAKRPPHPRHDDIERHLAHSFPYAETADQERAVTDIHEDLSGEQPMDRLLLGDVGFGKTEVAVRAAARVAYGGKQVALLAPTTILADQHVATFRERLRGLPLEISLLTRLTPKRNEKIEIEKIRNGQTDIVIGTHRLFSRDIAWRDLGLVIVDEEQRFGVRQKEHFKKLRAEVDILSLSATPIPRTLSLALSKFRDLSLISEPPSGRLPVKTFVLPHSEHIVREAIAAERERNGQVFYLWNRIETIETVRRSIENAAPGAKAAVLHGRMRERELIRTMHEFSAGKIDILVATTIIENGLDLPSVNTLIVANAGRLGLSQAYQIRGRIGRGDKPAYAYFLYPGRSLTEKGKLRLEALREAEGLGGGFQIALKDLEIRGAGNVLGRQQSGTMNRVGLNLYAQLLGEAWEGLA
ncbi:MAG: helicase-related protein [bacterium]|nr:helicase-related protein [bacterium]